MADSGPDVDTRLAAFDSVMWNVESDPLLRSVIVAVLVLDRPPEVATLTERIERLTRAVPRMRQRVVGNPASIVSPRWEVDPHFDLAYHLRWTKAPMRQTGLHPALIRARQMAEQDFDRDRPLWEMALVTGLDADQAALIVKIHHAITDGMGGLRLAAELVDVQRDAIAPLTPEPPPAPAPAPPSAPRDTVSRLLDASRTVAADALTATAAIGRTGVGVARHAAADPLGSVRSAGEFAASVGRLLAPASTPLSPLWSERSLSLHLAVLECPLDDLKAAARANGVTVNDAFLAAVIGGATRYHADRGSPARHGLRVNMPVDQRTGAQTEPGNHWVPARVVLPTDIDDPRARMKVFSPLLRRARTEPALVLSDAIYGLINATPRPVTTQIAGGLMKGTDLAVTNVPGPATPVFVAGAQVLRVLPFAPKAGAAANIALMSYAGTAQICLNVDPAAVTAPDDLVAAVQAALDEVVATGRPA